MQMHLTVTLNLTQLLLEVRQWQRLLIQAHLLVRRLHLRTARFMYLATWLIHIRLIQIGRTTLSHPLTIIRLQISQQFLTVGLKSLQITIMQLIIRLAIQRWLTLVLWVNSIWNLLRSIQMIKQTVQVKPE